MPTVAGPVQSGGTPTCLGVTLGPTFQQELAYCVVSIAAGIVLQGTETEVGQQNQAGDRGRGGESRGPRAEAWLHQLCDGQLPSSLASVSPIISTSQDCYENEIK